MAGPNRIDQTPVRLSTMVTEERQTPKTDFGTKLKTGVDATLGVAGSIVSGLPGGAILSAAVSAGSSLGSSRSIGAATGTATPAVATTGTGTGVDVSGIGSGSSAYAEGMSLLQAQQASNMQYLTLQNTMQQENQQFTSLSNVMKCRSDTCKNSIQNIH